MSDSHRLSRVAIFVMATYASLQMLSDIASLKIGCIMGYAVDMGTFIYPLTFTLRDLAHKLIGKRGIRTLIITTTGVNLLMALYLAFCAHVPSPPTLPADAHTHFQSVFSPVWRIVMASLLAELISELADTEVYHYFRSKTPRYQWLRVLASNAVSIPLDNLIFTVGAFAGLLPLRAVAQIFLMNLVVKVTVSTLGTPLIYCIPNHLDAFESIDNPPSKPSHEPESSHNPR